MTRRKNYTHKRNTYKKRKRNTYKKRKNKIKRSRRRNLKGGRSLRERATTKVKNMKKRGSEFWEKYGDKIKTGAKAAALAGTGLAAAHLLKNNKTYKEMRDQYLADHEWQKLEEEKVTDDATQGAENVGNVEIKDRIINECGESPDEQCLKDTIFRISAERREQQEAIDKRGAWQDYYPGGQMTVSTYHDNMRAAARGEGNPYVDSQNEFRALKESEMREKLGMPAVAPEPLQPVQVAQPVQAVQQTQLTDEERARRDRELQSAYAEDVKRRRGILDR